MFKSTFFGMIAEWLFYQVPWWAWALLVVVVGLLLWRLAKVPPKWILPIIALVAAALGYQQAAQRGWKAKEARDMRDADKLIEKARAARQKAESVPVENLRDDDGWRRD